MRRLVVILAIWAVGTGSALAQESAVSITEIQSQTIRLRPGFQQDVSIRGKAKIDSIHVGDPSVAAVTVVSDQRFLINALPPEAREPRAIGPRATNVLVRDPTRTSSPTWKSRSVIFRAPAVVISWRSIGASGEVPLGEALEVTNMRASTGTYVHPSSAIWSREISPKLQLR